MTPANRGAAAGTVCDSAGSGEGGKGEPDVVATARPGGVGEMTHTSVETGQAKWRPPSAEKKTSGKKARGRGTWKIFWLTEGSLQHWNPIEMTSGWDFCKANPAPHAAKSLQPARLGHTVVRGCSRCSIPRAQTDNGLDWSLDICALSWRSRSQKSPPSPRTGSARPMAG